MTLIPVTILTGFLGSGKTTLLKRVLTESHGKKIAVIENEFGQENIDNDILLSSPEEHIVQLNNGCVCCSIREDLRSTLSDLATKKHNNELEFSHVVIETTGVADPGPIAQTFFMDDEVSENYLLDAILTLVDAKHAHEQLNTRQEARRQVGFADYLFISKADLVSQKELDDLAHRLKHMNSRASQKIINFGQVSLRDFFDLRGFNFNDMLNIDKDPLFSIDDTNHVSPHEHGEHCTHHHYNDDVKSFVFTSERMLDAAKLEDFLGAIVNVYGARMLRYKGVLYMKDVEQKVIFQGVHQLMGSDLGAKWGPSEKKASKIVFIGVDLPQDILMKGLEQCLI